MSYKHLSLEERCYIEIELKKGTSINAIAKVLGRPQGTISKEILLQSPVPKKLYISL